MAGSAVIPSKINSCVYKQLCIEYIALLIECWDLLFEYISTGGAPWNTERCIEHCVNRTLCVWLFSTNKRLFLHTAHLIEHMVPSNIKRCVYGMVYVCSSVYVRSGTNVCNFFHRCALVLLFTCIGKCVCVCMHIYAHTYVYICAHTSTRVHYTRVYIYIYVYNYTCMCVYICSYIHMCMYVDIYMCIYIYIHMYVYHMRTRMHCLFVL